MRMSGKRTVQRIILVALALCVFQSPWFAAGAIEDPGVMGPLTVASKQYTGPDITLPDFPGPVEQLAIVWHPTALSRAYPLVIFLHGRHETCYQNTTVNANYPCPSGFQPIPSYRGYDYLAQSLASNGYIVVSISANGINARDKLVADNGALARAQLIQHHLNIWKTFDEGKDPFGGIFRGRVDLTNVGTMGHSRGGEGAARHVLLNAALGSPYRIKAVLPLAPTNFSRWVINGVPLGVLLPYCDGDVADLQGIHYYDDTRYNVASDAAAKHTFLVMGANHNFYNVVWTPNQFPGAADDWLVSSPDAKADPHCGSANPGGRLTPAQQQGTALAYVKAFFLAYLGNRTDFLPYLTSEVPPPPSAQTNQIHVAYHPGTSARRDVNRLLSASDLTTNTLGGRVSQSGITPYSLCGGQDPQPQHCLPTQPPTRQPHTAPTQSRPTTRGPSQLQVSWTSSTASYTNQIPAAGGNVSAFTALQFRVGVNFVTNLNPPTPQDLSVVLIDAGGRQAAVRVSAYSQALFSPPGSGIDARVPRVLLNTVRLPLAAFVGVDKTAIQSVQFVLNQQKTGAILVSDIAFAR